VSFDARRNEGERKMHPIRSLMRGLGSQHVARTNAAQASIRLQHQRRQVDDVEAYLSGTTPGELPAKRDTPQPGVPPTR
jgi:hypothetical protein